MEKDQTILENLKHGLEIPILHFDAMQSYRVAPLEMDNSFWIMFSDGYLDVFVMKDCPKLSLSMLMSSVSKGDGYLDVVVMKDCPKLSLAMLMSSMNKGGHVRSPHILYLKVKAFVLEPGPLADDPNKEGIIDVDGEVLARDGRNIKEWGKRSTWQRKESSICQGQSLGCRAS
ncbi:hypothetical protein T459_30436 [Capsicum annuum]|uniref:YegS/DAGK C-terminal domain-containing protein n=1 Tax=Capsicum annuum TaxID=4072 RepID=A0A2G2Y8Y4_CAPAN|nr:hypothetical protein T459_30436 [Capsicum annuum]